MFCRVLCHYARRASNHLPELVQHKDLGQPTSSSCAESGAVPDDCQTDRVLGEVVEAWPTLPDKVKAGIIGLVRGVSAK